MPRDIVSIVVKRAGKVKTDTAGYTPTLAPITGSPFQCRVFRKATQTVDRDEAAPAVATIDPMHVISFPPTAGVKVNDLATLPDGSTAKIIRIRAYKRTLQCDVETGVE